MKAKKINRMTEKELDKKMKECYYQKDSRFYRQLEKEFSKYR